MLIMILLIHYLTTDDPQPLYRAPSTAYRGNPTNIYRIPRKSHYRATAYRDLPLPRYRTTAPPAVDYRGTPRQIIMLFRLIFSNTWSKYSQQCGIHYQL